jgi:hypothetical protein
MDTGGEAPQLDPLFAGFADGYRRALEDGTAKVVGETTLEGRAATVLEFRGTVETTTVLVDSETYRPLRFFTQFDAGRRSPTWTVVKAETLPRSPAHFQLPKRSAPRPSAGVGYPGEPITIDRAAAVLGKPTLWLGDRFHGVALGSVERQRGRTEFTDGRDVDSAIVRLSYGRVRVWVASNVAGAYALGMEDGGDPPPPPGAIAITRDWGGPRDWEGELKTQGYWVRIVAPTREQLLDAARALRPLR